MAKQRLQEFRATVIKMPTHPSEEDYAAVRSAGVNVFVSVEELLEDIITFNTWVLFSDHFLDTQFGFKREEALKSVTQALGASIKEADKEFTWDESGANTLGTQLVYLTTLRDWLGNLITADRSDLERPPGDYPHYHNDPFADFPFKHSQLWADAAPETLAEYSGLINMVHQQATQADLANIRNGLDHKRDNKQFPAADRMLACISRLGTR